MATSKNNFFKDHYDWLVALVGLALLAGAGYLFATSLENTPEAASEKCKAELPKVPANKDVPQADLSKLTAIAEGLMKPTLLGEVKDDAGSFLASEHRVFCKSPDDPKCRRPIPFKSEVCTWCKGKQPSEKPEEAERRGTDLDNDGMTDAWEKRYGLNPDDRADADQDADGDLFTNLEEFNAKTNPKDPEDHPDYLDDLTIASALDTKTLPFFFSSYYQIRAGHRVTFEVTDGKYDSKTDAIEGEEILWTLKKSKTSKKEPSGWRLVKVVKKTKKVKRQGSAQEFEVDDSSVVLQRISDKREFTVPKNVKAFPIEEQLDLQWNRGETSKTFTVAKGTEFELNKRKYKVEELKKDRVTIVDLKTKEKRDFGEKASDSKSQTKSASAAKPSPGSKPSPNRKSVP